MEERPLSNERFPHDMSLLPVRRWPTVLPDATVTAIVSHSVPATGPPTIPIRASLVVPTADNLPFLRLCVESVLVHTDEEDYELVVVDNGSIDGTAEYLSELSTHNTRVRVIANPTNRGFPAAVNQGFEAATGSVLVALNDDTIVPPGWLSALLDRLSDSSVGMVVPRTNRSGNQSEIRTSYRTFGEFLEFAAQIIASGGDQVQDVPTLVMFCSAMRREVYERVGTLDEAFSPGLFEDDDYCRRLSEAGYRVVCALGSFVHHFGQTTIGRLAQQGLYGGVFDANRRRLESKWATKWHPHERPDEPGYNEMIDRIRAVASSLLAQGASVAVVSKGDERLLELPPARCCHFMTTPGGIYAGHHPRDAEEAIQRLGKLSSDGVDHVLIPESSYWWLDHYSGFKEHLERWGQRITAESESCMIFSLASSSASDEEMQLMQSREGRPSQ